LRIISGQHKGRRLQSISGTDVRPTADQVREALFNILSQNVSGSCVLDLFAGTGALGIEALSRGAQCAVFVDNALRPLTVLRKNLQNFGLLKQSKVIRWNISKNLNCLTPFHDKFDLVFLDPPYHRGLVGVTLSNLLQIQCLVSGATIVAEHEHNADVTSPDVSLSLRDQRRYGQTALTFFHFNPIIERTI
jgi:16S rRNA (guanine966-N2)-methyltransferase